MDVDKQIALGYYKVRLSRVPHTSSRTTAGSRAALCCSRAKLCKASDRDHLFLWLAGALSGRWEEGHALGALEHQWVVEDDTNADHFSDTPHPMPAAPAPACAWHRIKIGMQLRHWTLPCRAHARKISVLRFSDLAGWVASLSSVLWFLRSGGETQRGRLWTACGQRRVDGKNSQTTPATTSTTSTHQLLGAIDAQTAHHATSSTAPAHQPLGSTNAEMTPAGAPAAAADRKQRPDATCEGKNG